MSFYSGIRSKLTTGLILVWGAFLSCAMATLMAGHWVSLPHPETGAVLRTPSEQNDSQLNAFHFLYGDCACSKRILKSLLQREPLDGIHERIVLIGEDSVFEEKARLQGYAVTVVTPSELKQLYEIESAPLLIATDDAGTIRYSGGYTSRKQGLAHQDVGILQSLLAGQSCPELPVYGCAVSQRLKDLIDPLNLK